ncbi:PRD domain-containing protein [Enterococcus sp. S86.2]|uniref:PRD domain-containing protein n=1 Tax=Enterococcus sp. S86.2 TaxID=3031299 RepID=UPI0026EA4662|nr:PRD domain-containing protein [Enterococcus sp. S86.2]
MRIKQILNNNVALVKRGGHEIFVVSKGIGFKKQKGQLVRDEEVDKMYILDSFDMLDHFSYLLSHSDPNDIILINNIISYAEKELQFQASDYLSLTLLDHLEFLIKRVEKKQYIKSPLIWDVKRFYPKHFQVGIRALRMIEEQKGIQLPDDEAVSISLHFVNMEESKIAKQDKVSEMQILGDIISIIEKNFHVKLDENSTNFLRFTNHLQYFIQRVMKGELHNEGKDTLGLYQQVSQLYPAAFKAVQKIKVYIQSQFDSQISIDEETYLILHIRRVTERLEEEK